MAYFEQAAEAYELTADKFARSDKAADALFNAGVLRQALGQHRRAIGHYEAYATRFRDRKDAEDVAFRVGAVYEAAGDDGRADRAFRDYVKRYRGGEHLVEAHTRAGRTSLRLGQLRRAKGELDDALEAYTRLRGEPRRVATPWAAEARYQQGELLYREYASFSLDVPPARLKRTLEKKTKLLDDAMAIYLDVVEYRDPEWATAALYRIGAVFEEFAKAMQEAPTPKGLSAEEQQVYRDELDVHVIDIEERAIELYTTGYTKALQLRVYNKYTRLLREALTRMARSQYPAEAEARDESRLGDRPPRPAIIHEVRRDD
jgi:tetratricopeptide (TPR) repeat protein